MMKAGRELDALIAEKVMGLVLTCPVDPRFDHSVGTNTDGSSAKRNFCRWPDGRDHWIPFFSTDIANAWQVVGQLMCAHWEPAIDYENARGQWCCEVSDGTRLLRGFADTAPLAICLAALKACGVEVEP